MIRKKYKIIRARKNKYKYKQKRKKFKGRSFGNTLKTILLLCTTGLVENEKKKQLCDGKTCCARKGNIT